MERRVLDKPEFNLTGQYGEEIIDTVRSIITSAAPGRDAIAGTIANAGRSVRAHFFRGKYWATPQWIRPNAMQHEFVFGARETGSRIATSLLCGIATCWDMWFDQSLVKDGDY